MIQQTNPQGEPHANKETIEKNNSVEKINYDVNNHNNSIWILKQFNLDTFCILSIYN